MGIGDWASNAWDKTVKYGQYVMPVIRLWDETTRKLFPDTKKPGTTTDEQSMLDRNSMLFNEQQQTMARQNQLSDLLFASSQGQGPSYAGLQLGQGLENIQRGSMNAAAGAGGNEGVLARYAAINSAANAGAQANQSAALARAQEIAQARQLLGENLGNTANEVNNIYGANVTGVTGQQTNDITQQKNANDTKIKYTGSLMGGISGAGAQGASA